LEHESIKKKTYERRGDSASKIIFAIIMCCMPVRAIGEANHIVGKTSPETLSGGQYKIGAKRPVTYSSRYSSCSLSFSANS
jgi:hypothetical protein